MKLNRIYSAILLSTLPLTPALAAGLDRSGQSIAAFLQPGNYAEAGISILDPKVQSNQLKVNDMAEDYYFPSAAIKVQATEQISIGLLYETNHLVLNHSTLQIIQFLARMVKQPK